MQTMLDSVHANDLESHRIKIRIKLIKRAWLCVKSFQLLLLCRPLQYLLLKVFLIGISLVPQLLSFLPLLVGIFAHRHLRIDLLSSIHH